MYLAMLCVTDSKASKQPSSVRVAIIHPLTKGLTHWLKERAMSVISLAGCNNLIMRFWCSAVLFWGRNGDRSAWLLSTFSFLIILGNLGTLYGINVWSRELFDALERYQTKTVFFLSLIYFPLLAVSVFFVLGQVWARMTLQRRWRAWLNGHLMDRWLANGRYYKLNLQSGEHKNPEFRIAEDLRVATEAPVDFATGIISALLSAATFVFVLWSLGGSLQLGIAGIHVAVPGFLVITTIVYALLATVSIAWIGRRFIPAAEAKNQAEAEYRYVLTRLRDNAESIALMRGESAERTSVEQSLCQVLRSWRAVCFQCLKTTFVSQTSGFFAPILPVLLCAPKFLDGSLTLGQVMQAASAFTIVQAAFAWLVDNYPKRADWAASARRVASLMIALDHLEQVEGGNGISHIPADRGREAALRLVNLSVTLEDGTPVVEKLNVAVRPGERLLICGDSGAGKSTLLRAIAGLWPWGYGRVEVADHARVFFLPQRPYIPLGTLRRAVTYPNGPDARRDATVAEAFRSVGLEQYLHLLDAEAPWDQILSGGEKQRLAFARILLSNPDIIVMDEATSALDPRSQDLLMGLLVQHLGRPTIISVGHRPELEDYHDRKIVLERSDRSVRIISDVPIARRSRAADPFPRGLSRKAIAATSRTISVNSRMSGVALLSPSSSDEGQNRRAAERNTLIFSVVSLLRHNVLSHGSTV